MPIGILIDLQWWLYRFGHSLDPKAPTAYIALGELGDVRLETGAAYIYRENNQRFVPLKYSVRGRDLGSTVAEAQQRIGDRVKMPEGYKLDWTGEFDPQAFSGERVNRMLAPLRRRDNTSLGWIPAR